MGRPDWLLRYALRAVLLGGFLLVGWLLGTSAAHAAPVQPLPAQGVPVAAVAVTLPPQPAVPVTAPHAPAAAPAVVSRPAVVSGPSPAPETVRTVLKVAVASSSQTVKRAAPAVRSAVATAATVVPKAVADTSHQGLAAAARVVAPVLGAAGTVTSTVAAATVPAVPQLVGDSAHLALAASSGILADAAVSTGPADRSSDLTSRLAAQSATAEVPLDGGPVLPQDIATVSSATVGALGTAQHPTAPLQPGMPRYELATLAGVGTSSWNGMGFALAVLATSLLFALSSARTAFPRAWAVPRSLRPRPCFSPD